MQAKQRRELVAEARFGRKTKAVGSNGMVVTSHPIVTQAGVDILRAGGNAADAALGAAVVQAVVEPHMTTICGMLSMLFHDATAGETTYVNGSMNRPAGLTSYRPADADTGRSVAVPGFWAAFEAALARHGSRPKAELVGPAIELARDGFEVHPFLYGMAFKQIGTLGRYPEGRTMFFPEGRLIEPGETLRQPRLADTLSALVADGSEYFYRGEFAQKMVDVVTAAGGVLTRQDLESYEARWMKPARGTYRGYDVVGSPPPDNGGTHVIEILNLIEQIPLLEWGPPTESADSLYWLMRFCGEVYTEGGKQRDPQFYPVPLDLITSKEYAARRFELMRMSAPAGTVAPPSPGSNHITVVDNQGNVASLLHSVASQPWSNGLFVDGVQLWAGAEHFARVLPPAGGRASCYVAPTIIFENGMPILTAGSPSIGLIQTIVQNTLNILDFGMDIDTSVHTPRFGGPSPGGLGELPGGTSYYCEADIDESLRNEVMTRGLAIDVVNPWNFDSGSYEGIHIDTDHVMTACADPRRAGKALAA